MSTTPLLQMTAVGKSFPGVQALADVDLTLQRGEVLALVGENGAGKSTLIKILAGVHQPDAGTIAIDGRPTPMRTPLDARRAGVSVIYQELNLVGSLSAVANLFLGREGTPWLRHGDERSRARELFARLGVDIPLDTPCAKLTIAQQQVVEIARAVGEAACRILVLDEPSAALTPLEVERLFGVIRELTGRGIGVIYISHRLEEIFALADRVAVLRDGRHVATRRRDEFSRTALIEAMVGRRLEQEFPAREPVIGLPRLVADRLCRGRLRDISFTIHRGEILALTGLVGAGRTETARLLFGADQPESGTIALDGRPLRPRTPRDAIAAGICLLTEDRKAQGLVLGRSVLENFALPNLGRWATLGWIHRRRERTAFDLHAAALRIRTAHAGQAVRDLSGGNQQKVVLAKWLEASCEVVIFDEPTRGIDVGAKYEIYLLMNKLARAGKAILMISSELPEVLGMADRILVLHESRIRGEIKHVKEATQADILRLAVDQAPASAHE